MSRYKMKYYYWFIFFIQLSKVHTQSISTTENIDEETTTQSTATTSLPIIFLDEDEPEYIWNPQSMDSIIVQADEGFKISFNITECNIDGEDGDYASISTGEESSGLIFTYKIGGQSTYVYNSNILYGKFFGTSLSNFTGVFMRVGERLVTTTTEIPATTISLPAPSKNDSSTLLVYLQGRPLNEYDDEQVEGLKNAIVNMATEYCENENFPLNGTITTSNVIIHRLGSCSMNWPIYEVCVELNISVPVNLLEDSKSIWMGYQITTEHLRIMWDRYATSQLPDDITYFFEFDMSNLKWGIIIAVAVIIAFIVVMVLVRYSCAHISNSFRKRRHSDTNSIISTSDRNSETSLPPHYLQETPPLFENAYPMYNPDKSTTYSEPPYTKPLEYLDVKRQFTNEEEESGA